MYILNSKATTKKKLKRSITEFPKREKWSNIKCLIKTTKGRKREEDKTRNKAQGQQIENSDKYGKC